MIEKLHIKSEKEVEKAKMDRSPNWPLKMTLEY